MRVLTKKEITEEVERSAASLMIETYCGARPARYLKIMVLVCQQPPRTETIGRVPKSIYNWFNIVPMIAQPGFINVKWEKFVTPTP